MSVKSVGNMKRPKDINGVELHLTDIVLWHSVRGQIIVLDVENNKVQINPETDHPVKTVNANEVSLVSSLIEDIKNLKDNTGLQKILNEAEARLEDALEKQKSKRKSQKKATKPVHQGEVLTGF